MRWRRRVEISFAAGLWLATGAAHSQQVTELRPSIGDTEQAAQTPAAPVTRKPAADPYAPVGFQRGGIIFYPVLAIGTVATSNVRQSSSGQQSAIGVSLTPSLRFESDWVRHSWVGEANYDGVGYPDHKDFSTHEANLFSKFQLDIRRHTRAEFEAGYNLDQSGFADSEVPATAESFRTEHEINATVALIHDFGSLETRLRTGVGLNLYDDVKLSGGGSEDNSDRNYATPLLSLRATYTDPPVLQPYVQAAYVPRYYLQKRDRNGLQRSSQGLAASAGVVIDFLPIWSGDIAATYLWRDYDDAALESNGALGLDGSLTWSPDELTRVVLAFGTSLEDAISTTSSSNRYWTGRIDLTHALHYSIEVLAGSGVEIEETDKGDDFTYEANLGLAWKLGPSLAWITGYDVTWLDAADSSRSFTEHRISTGLALSR